MLHSMAKLAPKITITLAALMLALSAAPAYADRCESSCGPAPCCMLLWVPWCGCWFDEPDYPQQVVSVFAPEQSAASAACALESGTSFSDLLNVAEQDLTPASVR